VPEGRCAGTALALAALNLAEACASFYLTRFSTLESLTSGASLGASRGFGRVYARRAW